MSHYAKFDWSVNSSDSRVGNTKDYKEYVMIVKLYQLLVYGHVCKWKEVSKGSYYWNESDKIPSGSFINYQCEKCLRFNRVD